MVRAWTAQWGCRSSAHQKRAGLGAKWRTGDGHQAAARLAAGDVERLGAGDVERVGAGVAQLVVGLERQRELVPPSRTSLRR